MRSGRPNVTRTRDRGAASIYAATAGMFLTLAGLAVATHGMRVVAAGHARTAADLGALAGAMRSAEGPGPACARAAELVSANGGHLVFCQLDGLDIKVTADFRGATATARAGPVRSHLGRGPVPNPRPPLCDPER